MVKSFGIFRLRILLLLIMIIPLGLGTKWYGGPGAVWVNDYAGGLLYEIFWCLFVAFIWPRLFPLLISLSVFLITCMLEVLQLWHPPFMEFIRSYWIGRTLIGTSFSWLDFPHYMAGSVLGWLIIRFIRNRTDSEFS